jgi:hypothetical protein
MAKYADQRAGSFETENTGGLLTGFLAEEDVFDRRSLWRIGSWGVGAVAAVTLAVLASQSSIAVRREQVAAADLTRQAQQIQSVARESQNETRRLASAVDTLNGDRDRLYSRVTALEQGLDSMTGAIARQNAAAVSPQAVPPPAAQKPAPAPVISSVATAAAKAADMPPIEATAPERSPAAVSSVAQKASNTATATEPQPAAQNPPPATVVSSVATTAAKAADTPPSEATAPERSPAAVSSAAQKASNTPAATPVIPLVASKSMMAPPDAAAGKLIEPEKSAPVPEVVAAISPAEADASQAAPSDVAVQRTEFGVDIGGANSLGGLRALWRGLLKSRSNAVLTTLRPIIVIREGRTGLGMQLRLVAGPLSDVAAAVKICATLMENDRTCETTVFDGQRLVMKADEPEATAKPAAAKPFARRRSAPKRVAIEEPPKKPDPPSTLSSFFGRR